MPTPETKIEGLLQDCQREIGEAIAYLAGLQTEAEGYLAALRSIQNQEPLGNPSPLA